MEDIRNYSLDDETRDDEQREFSAAGAEDDEVPFHIPRD